MKYWLFKTEPGEYSISDLEKEGRVRWDGIRNYQARNLLRDQIKQGDSILLYHSSCKPTAIVGNAVVCKPAYPDPSQFDKNSPYFDPKSSEASPRWFCVDIEFLSKFQAPLTLQDAKTTKTLENMALLRQGRLSVQPVTKTEYDTIIELTASIEAQRSQ